MIRPVLSAARLVCGAGIVGNIDSKSPVLKKNPSPRHDIATGNTKYSGKDCRVDLLNHEQRDIQKSLSIIKSVSSTQNLSSVSPHVPGESNARAKVTAIVVRQRRGSRMIYGLKNFVGPAIPLGFGADQIEILVPAET